MSKISINIGCGTDIREGYLNLDIRALPGVDVVHDLTKPLPFADNYADHILANDLIEHFEAPKAEILLKDWIRCLKPGGTIELKTPDLDVLCEKILKNVSYRQQLIQMMFGGQEFATNYHYWLYGKQEIKALLMKCGCRKIVKVWGVDLNHNMCIIAEK